LNRASRGPQRNPSSEGIKAARAAAGLTQPGAADVIYSTVRTWQDWESGQRRMHPGLFELFVLKTTSANLLIMQSSSQNNAKKSAFEKAL
jgi:DNA-binding transcriptional regulator YiaG